MTVYERQERIRYLQEYMFSCIYKDSYRAEMLPKISYWLFATIVSLFAYFYLINNYSSVFSLFYKISAVTLFLEAFSIFYLKLFSFRMGGNDSFIKMLSTYEPVDIQGYLMALRTLKTSRADRFTMVLSWLNHEKHLLDSEGDFHSRVKNK